ncbi:MAG: hypothetical protein COB85_04845 [Bacteroidetes bacterium]|nr:MAG: hypothetical protein COB85_04845 [Bacteroidota bacterium]
MQIEDKTVLITGGAGGIGKFLVEHFSGVANKVIALDINKAELDNLQSENKNVSCYNCDVTDFNQVAKTIDKVIEDHGVANILINNAGWIYSAPLINMLSKSDRKHDPETWRKVIDTNLNSVFYMTSCIVDKMISNRTKGLIINVSTISADGIVGQSAYAAAKAGVRALTSVWSKELAIHGIRCAAYAPGIVDSPSMDEALSEAHIKKWEKAIPLGRFCSMEEILKTVKFIIDNDYFNSKVLPIDGGLAV